MTFPEGFLDHLREAPGFAEQNFVAAHDAPPPVSIRLNPAKSLHPPFSDAVPWCTNACYLPERPAFTLDPLLHAGAYYVQEASSMFLDHVIRSTGLHAQPARFLDLCAAPGGKSTLIASAMHSDSVLFSNEVIRNRIGVLRENLTKWGAPNVVITSNDASDFSSMHNFFDAIAVDAPCSGSGMFRKDPAAMREWSAQHVVHCSKRQTRIVDDIFPALKTNGYLIYATCSYSEHENEHIVQHLIDKGMQVIMDPDIAQTFPGIIATPYGYRFYPDKIRGEGFFISVLQKLFSNETDGTFRAPKMQVCDADVIELISPWVNRPERFTYIAHNEQIVAIPHATFQALQYAGTLHIQQAGITIGEIKHNLFIPAHALAVSTIASHNIQKHDVDLDTALQFLRKNTITPTPAHTGWMLITYRNVPLGFVKSIPGRWNNYYPTEWRLRK